MEAKNISRRNFIKTTGLSGTAFLTLGYAVVNAKATTILTAETATLSGIELNAWITIDQSGLVTLVNHRAEMGQGSFQSVPQIIAEELEVDLNAINIVFAPADSRYGSQITGGSSTIRGAYKNLLYMGASAREMLIEAAAQEWKVDKSACYAEKGFVIHKATNNKIGYGNLVEAASKLQVPKDVILKDTKDYKILRKPLPRQDTPIKTNGKAIFGIDKVVPGMLFASIERTPKFRGKVKSFNEAAAMAISGVKYVIKVEAPVFSTQREGVAVIADNYWSALQGRKALKVEWDDSGFEHYSTEQLYQKMRDQLKSDQLISFKTKGNVKSAFDNGANKIEAIYETPYEAHSCMEPLNCIADYKDDKCEIWGPIQAPDWVQNDLVTRLKLPKEKIVVNMTFLGGGFGRKAFFDYPYEAAILSKEVKAPVKVIWTREDDTTIGPFRPGMVYQCKGSINENKKITSFEVKMAGQNMDHQWPGAEKTTYNSSVTEGFLEPYLDSLPNYSFGDIPLDAPIPVMWWRSVYSSTNAFAFESFLDELAISANKDPLEFRKEYLRDERYQKLIDKLSEITNWKTRIKNEGWGIAVTECFSSIVGEAVKVSRGADNKLKIDKVFAVMDCGWYVNPDIIKAQIEGSIVMALGAATIHATEFKDGKAVQENFNTYKMPRIGDIPEIEIFIMENDEKAGGVGEPSLPPFAPALCNAIFDLTGKRIRKLPFNMKEV